MKRFITSLQSLLDLYLASEPKGRDAGIIGAVLFVLLLICGLIMYLMGPLGLSFDLFFIPIFLAVFVFKRKGLWAFLPAGICFHVCLRLHGGENLSLFQYFSADIFELFSWVVVSFIAIYVLHRYKKSQTITDRVLKDFNMASTLQTALCPDDMVGKGVKINGAIRQCRDIGGDYYYFRPFQDRYHALCLGDVMGKGVAASMVMAIIVGFFLEWCEKTLSPGELLQRLNQRLLKLWPKKTCWYTTIFYAVYDERTHFLTYASGAHHEALLLRKRGSVEYLTTRGLPIGVFPNQEWDEKQVVLESGDRVVVFTDGVTEAIAPNGEMFGMENAVAVLSEPASCNTELIFRLEEALIEYNAGNFSDDVAILVMEIQ